MIRLQGWIGLHRKLMNNPVWSDPNYLKLWIYCLLKATHKPHEQKVGNQMVQLEKGQFVTGRKILAEDMNKGVKADQQLSEKSWERYLKNLEKWQMLTIKVTNKYSVVTVDKYEFYQTLGNQFDQVIDQQLTSKCPASDQQLTTNNNVNNVKKVKKNIYAENVSMTDEQFQKLIVQFGEVGARERIENLSLYKTSKGKKYKCDYSTILTWERKNAKVNITPQGHKKQNQFTQEDLMF